MGVWTNISHKKTQGRLKTIALNSVSQLIFPAAGIMVSWAVFHFCSDGLWGQFVAILLILNFAPHIMGWGNKDYLLRTFSLQPAMAAAAWAQSLASRALFIPVLAIFIVFFPISIPLKIIVFAWCVARFIYQSYDVVILYKKKFLYTFLLEGMGLAIMLAFIIQNQKAVELQSLAFAFLCVEMIKAVSVMFLFYKSFPVFGNLRPDQKYFSAAFSFFILGFSGLVQSRTDLLCITYFMPAAQTGHFQVLTTFLLYTQAVAGFILTPYVKNLYRMGGAQIARISAGLFAAGIGLVTFAMLCIYGLVHFFYHFDPGIPAMVFGGLSALPIFFYLPYIYELYKYNAQNHVLWVNFLGIGVGFILNVIFIRSFANGINGALAATALTQWLFIPVYLYLRRSVVQDKPVLKEDAHD